MLTCKRILCLEDRERVHATDRGWTRLCRGTTGLHSRSVSCYCGAPCARETVCQEISVPLCRGIGYNYTYMPNQYNHDTQDEAGLEVHQFWPLVEIQCSPDLRFFLCSLYTPICLEDYRKPLPPCRSVCERAKAGCAPLMRQYGFPWPDRMRCDLLPVQGDPNTLCMDYNRTAATASPVAPKPTSRPGKPWKNKSSHGSSLCEPECHCRAPLVTVSDRHPLYITG